MKTFQEHLSEVLEAAMQKKHTLAFYTDYYRLYAKTAYEKCSIAHLPHNKPKNQGNHWGFPYDTNLIQSIPDYINASPMQFGKFRYIASQGPRKATFENFWQMVWAENVQIIATVTNEHDRFGNGKMEIKFERYWPENEDSYGEFSIKLLKEELIREWHDGREEKIRKRIFSVQRQHTKREITHLHLENWPDNGVIHPESLFHFSVHLDEELTQKENQSLVVHCAAGIGRTGTLIAFHSLFHEIQNAYLNNALPNIDVWQRVNEMRSLRYGAVISSHKQYDLVVEALKIAFNL